MNDNMIQPDATDPAPLDRRSFLQQATAVSAGVAALTEPPASATDNNNAPATPAIAEGPLPTVALGPHRVTRLIIGANPFYGYSHFNHLLSRHQQEYNTTQRVVETLQRAEKAGVNTWQSSYHSRMVEDLDRYRAAGGKLQWLCLGKGDWDQNPKMFDEAARRKPIGIAPHGALADRLHRQQKTGVLVDLLKRIRDSGVLVGLSCHNPVLTELAIAKDWDVDYYMCALYNLTRPIAETRKLLGGAEPPLGEVYLPTDPPRMFRAIRAAKKPCLAYKLLAAGRRIGSPKAVRECFKETFDNIKPTDAAIVGMYQQFGDQVGENARLVREVTRVV